MSTGTMGRRRWGGRSGWPTVVALFFTLGTSAAPLIGQARTLALRGTVFDSIAHPMDSVLVYLDSAATYTYTQASGAFRLAGVARGFHHLHFRKHGHAPRSFAITITDHVDDGQLGAVVLTGGRPPRARIKGVVSQSGLGEPVPMVAVGLNGVVAASTNRDGRFDLPATTVRWGPNVLEVRRIGYRPLSHELWVSDYGEDFSLALMLEPLPLQLAEYVVDGDRTIIAFGRLREFYRRRRSGFGNFVTRYEIEQRDPRYLTDALRTIPGLIVSGSGIGGRSVRFLRSQRMGGCPPLVFLDGMPLPDANLDRWVVPQDVAGVEIYSGPSETPPEFNRTGASCGTIVIWTQ